MASLHIGKNLVQGPRNCTHTTVWDEEEFKNEMVPVYGKVYNYFPLTLKGPGDEANLVLVGRGPTFVFSRIPGFALECYVNSINFGACRSITL